MATEQRSSPGEYLSSPGPYLATVVGHVDPTYMGTLEVQLLRYSGNDGTLAGQLHYVNYLSPFAGQTGLQYISQNDGYNETQKSYGFWMIPPDPGTLVMVMFIEGDPRKGYWIGCIQDLNMNFMMPGNAATEKITTKSTDKSRVPAAEYNKLLNDSPSSKDLTQINKPATPQEVAINDQGLLNDDTRGITTSSARREVPSSVFGISTPGPLDKKSGKKGKLGKKQNEINHFVSRLTGSSFVMDDGDSRWERKKTPTEGPPEYADVESGETGLRDRPHNELIRFRTRTGHQILLHNSEDLIYIGNSRGTAWIELTSDGKIDVYAEDSINIRTKQDFNFYCDRDFNLEVGRNFNTKVHGEMHTQVIKDQVLIVERDQKIHIKRRRDETIDEQYRQTVNDDVKKFYAKDYTHNVDGRMDFRVADGMSFTAGKGPKGPKFAPFDSTREDPEDPCANDGDTSSPVEDHNGPTPNSVDIRISKNVFFTVDNGNLDTNVSGHIYTTSGGNNETKAGGPIIEEAPVIHMNGPSAQSATLSQEARTSAKSTIPLVLKTHKLPDLDKQDADSTSDISLIMRRMTTPEPYPHHENLDPMKVKPKETARDVDGRYREESESIRSEPEYWKKYTTSRDTFKRS